MIIRVLRFSLLFAALWILPAACADVVPIGPFHGALSEDFNSYSQGARQQQSIMGGAGTVRNLTSGGSLKMEFFSSLGGVVVVPRSPPLMMGQLGISSWEFDTPLAEFGSYFANNSRFKDAQVDFYDINGALIDSVTATVPISHGAGDWTWNGWRSDVPIKRLVITGNDAVFVHGFIWFDDVEASPASPGPIPEPASLVLLGLSGLIVTLFCCRKVIRLRNRAD
jgi:hypothetical protein